MKPLSEIIPVIGQPPRFEPRALSILAYALDFTLWLYRCPADRLDDVRAAGFFDVAADRIRPGDVIYITAADGVAQHAIARGEIGRVILAGMSL